MSVIGPMKKFDPLPIPFQSVPNETESQKSGPDWSASAWSDIWTPSLRLLLLHTLTVTLNNNIYLFAKSHLQEYAEVDLMAVP